MKESSVKDYAEVMGSRYRKAGKREKGHLLDEFTTVTGRHRKSAIRLLSDRGRSRGPGRTGRPRRYGSEVVLALRRVWEVSDRLSGKRLAPFMGELATKLQEWEELRVPGLARLPSY